MTISLSPPLPNVPLEIGNFVTDNVIKYLEKLAFGGQEDCQLLATKANLVMPTSYGENKCLNSLLQHQHMSYAWIGVYTEGDPKYGPYKYVNGDSLLYSDWDWASNYPRNIEDYLCAVDHVYYGWMNVNCDFKSPYVCQVPTLHDEADQTDQTDYTSPGWPGYESPTHVFPTGYPYVT